MEQVKATVIDYYHTFIDDFSSTQTYVQLAALLLIYGLAYGIAAKIKSSFKVLHTEVSK
jgi:hypothetical protein